MHSLFLITYDSSKRHQNLFHIADARYLYVAYLLFHLSGTCTVCKKKNGLTAIPRNVCFLPNFGSSDPTSDHDVTLVGPGSASLTAEFNGYFSKTFKKPSEQVLDTNIYAYSLEYAIPKAFSGLPKFYTYLALADCEAQFQMLELAGAYMKVIFHQLHMYL